MTAFSTAAPAKVENLSTFPVTEGGFYDLSTGFPHSFPLPAAAVHRMVDNSTDNRAQPVDKLGVTFFAGAAANTGRRRCG
jgi:hypothetical protein